MSTAPVARPTTFLVVALFSLCLVMGSCGPKKSETTTPGSGSSTGSSPATTTTGDAREPKKTKGRRDRKDDDDDDDIDDMTEGGGDGDDSGATSAPDPMMHPGHGALGGAAGEGEASGFGLSKEKAVNVCSPAGERGYLDSLRCPDGAATSSYRVGSVGSRHPAEGFDMKMMDADYVLPAGTVDSHVIDLYEVSCSGSLKVEVYLDMYHCGDPDPVRSVGPLRRGRR